MRMLAETIRIDFLRSQKLIKDNNPGCVNSRKAT